VTPGQVSPNVGLSALTLSVCVCWSILPRTCWVTSAGPYVAARTASFGVCDGADPALIAASYSAWPILSRVPSFTTATFTVPVFPYRYATVSVFGVPGHVSPNTWLLAATSSDCGVVFLFTRPITCKVPVARPYTAPMICRSLSVRGITSGISRPPLPSMATMF
jgi:hypothetical protein